MPMPPFPTGPFDTDTVLDDLTNSFNGTGGSDHIVGASKDYLDGGHTDLLTGGEGKRAGVI